MYDLDMAETSKGALVELSRALSQYRDDMVLAGGWAPYFLVEDYFDHCGSIDIDYVLKPVVVERYENIKWILERLGYTATGSVFRFEREIVSPSSGFKHRIEVDFLAEPESAEALPDDWLVSVQRDLKACIIKGCSIVFGHNFMVDLRAVMPGDGEASARFRCANVVASLTMKGLALYRLKDKDSYDIYSVAGFYGGGPRQASDAFMNEVRDTGLEETVIESYHEIKDTFSTRTSQGPSAVSRFIGSEDAREDSYQRVRQFLSGISL